MSPLHHLKEYNNMACALTQGYVLDCKDEVGGLKSIRLVALADWLLMAPVYAADGTVEVTPATNGFYKYEQLKETSSITETINSSASAGTVYYTPEVTLVISKLASAMRNEIQLLSKNRLVAIVETNGATPTFFVCGVTTGLEVSAGTSASGTAYADLQGYTITLSGMEPESMWQMTQSEVDSVTN